MAYPGDFTPTYLHHGASGTGVGQAVDISCANNPHVPVVLIITFTGTATYKIQGSHDNVEWADWTTPALSVSCARDLVLGVRYWRVNVSANSALFTAAVGPVPRLDGSYVKPNLVTTFGGPTF